MSIARAILLCVISLPPTAGRSVAQTPRPQVVSEEADGVFIRASALDARAEKICDPAHYEKIDHDGIRTYVLLRHDAHRVWLDLLQCDDKGVVGGTLTLANDKLNCVTAIVGVVRLPDGRLFIEGHVNPWQSVAIAIDLHSGSQLTLVGNRFACSPSGRHIAYLVEVPPGSGGTQMQLCLDGKTLRELARNDEAELSWDSEGKSLTVSPANAAGADAKVIIQVKDTPSIAASN